jgi:hypothetical protein
MLQSFIRTINKVSETTRIVRSRVANASAELGKPKSFFQGEQFEEYVENNLFPDSKYVLVKRTDNYERNRKRFSESSTDPDLLFRCRDTNQEFAVEAKYRSKPNRDGNLAWCKEKQLKRYSEIDRNNIPVFIAVGLGGVSHKPDRLFLFPVRFVKYINLNMSIAKKHEIHQKQMGNFITPDYLWQILRTDSAKRDFLL